MFVVNWKALIKGAYEDVFEQGFMPNTPKGETISRKRQGPRSKSSKLF